MHTLPRTYALCAAVDVVSVRSALPCLWYCLIFEFSCSPREVGVSPVGDDAGAEPARRGAPALADDLPAEDEVTLSGRPMSEVVADQLLEEDPPATGESSIWVGELACRTDSSSGTRPPVSSAGERLRQPGQPPAGQPVIFHRSARRRSPAPPPRPRPRRTRCPAATNPMPALAACRLAYSLPVQVDLPGIGEVAGELHADRPEFLIDAIEVVLVHHPAPGTATDTGPGDRVAALLGPQHPLLFLGHPGIQHLVAQPPVSSRRQVPPGDLVLALPPGEPHQVPGPAPRCSDRCPRRTPRSSAASAPRRRTGAPVPEEERGDPCAVLQPGLVQVQDHPVDASISNLT